MKILIICTNEICYNPRLLKAADFFYEKGAEVTVFNVITGIASVQVYQNTLNSRKWKIVEYNISKRNFQSYLNWLKVSLINKTVVFLWNYLRFRFKPYFRFRFRLGFKYFLSKGLIGFPGSLRNAHFDYILIHLVDILPLTVELKEKTNARIIYDSQEYFKGQYMNSEPGIREWVHTAERENIGSIDVLLATTHVMRKRIIDEYNLKMPSVRVRNLPSFHSIKNIDYSFKKHNDTEPLSLIWHGLGIYFNNTRGVHIIVKALANCKTNARLFLQGKINTVQKQILDDYIIEYNLQNRIFLVGPADPDKLVESLVKYDVGVLGELIGEENQLLTSQNKLFDFLCAGLPVIAPDTLGIIETMNEVKAGLIYPPGDYMCLASQIDKLSDDRNLLKDLRKKAIDYAPKELYWEKDYELLWKVMTDKK